MESQCQDRIRTKRDHWGKLLKIKGEGFRNRQRKPETIINPWHPWKEGEGLNRRRLGCVQPWESLCQPSPKQTTHWKSPRWAELAWPQAPLSHYAGSSPRRVWPWGECFGRSEDVAPTGYWLTTLTAVPSWREVRTETSSTASMQKQ